MLSPMKKPAGILAEVAPGRGNEAGMLSAEPVANVLVAGMDKGITGGATGRVVEGRTGSVAA